MSYSGFGLFVPEDNSIAQMGVLVGTIGSHITPTPPDKQRSIMSPYFEQVTNISRVDKTESSVHPEAVAGFNCDPDNYPADRSLVSDEINDAIRGGNMTISLRGESSTKLHNNDIGNNILQLPHGGGLYQDFMSRGTFVWHKNDPILAGNVGDNSYYGKSRVPVMDYLDAIVYYDFDGETILTTVRNTSIYSDGDFIYSVGTVDYGMYGSDVCVFVFEPYRRSFVKRSKINSIAGEFISLTTNTTMFSNSSGRVPMSPVITRVKFFMNKMVCVFMGVPSSSPNAVYLYIYQSLDNGFTWELLTQVNKEAFYLYFPTTSADFRVRIASDGFNVCIAWGVIEVAPLTGLGQIRLMYSKDGCSTWEYGYANLGKKFLVNSGDLNEVTSSSSKTNPSNIYFGLSCDNEGRFIISKAGDGLTTESGVSVTGDKSIVFGIIDRTDVSEYLILKPHIDFYDTIDPMQLSLTVFKDVSLFSDKTNNNEYAVIRINLVSAYLGYTANQYMTCLVRYKIMKKREWTTCPGWSSTGISTDKEFGDHILFLEPPNRNNAFISSGLGTGATSEASHEIFGTEHRGHLFTHGGASQNSLYKYLACFRAWNNVPINYSLRQSFHPVFGAPNSSIYSMPGYSVGAGASVTTTTSQNTNSLRFLVPSGTSWTAASSLKTYGCQSIPTSLTNLASSMIGCQENVIRLCVAKFGGVAGSSVRIFDSTCAVGTAGAAWSVGVFVLFLTGANTFEVSDDYTVTKYALTDPSTGLPYSFLDDVYYEFMFVRKNFAWSVFYRVYNDETNSKIVEDWKVGYSRSSGSNGGAFTVGATYTGYRFGIAAIESPGLVYPWIIPNNIAINIKNISTSKSNTDIYPTASNYQGQQSYDTYLNYILIYSDTKGVLSSETDWNFQAASTAEMMRYSVRGEFMTPNPAWVGTDWLAVTTSNFAKKDAVLWLNFKTAFPITKAAVMIMKNEGNLADYNNGDFIMGNGSGIITIPTLQSPMGAYFDGANKYMYERFANSNLDLLNNFTISFWIKRTNASAGYVLSRGDGASGYRVYYNAVNTRFDFEFLGGRSSSPAVFTGADINRYVHVLLTIKDNVIRWFKNGVDIGTSAMAGNITSYPNQRMYIGCNSSLATKLLGYLSKIAIFNRVLQAKEITLLSSEGAFGPMIPSDFFVRMFGSHGSMWHTWRAIARDAGGTATNVLNDMVGSCYYSERDGLGGAGDGGAAGYNYGDTELVLYNTLGGYINANAALIMNCNATDVIIYNQSADPRLGAAWSRITAGDFKYHDQYYGIANYIFNDTSTAVVSGIITKQAALNNWRPGVYNGKRLQIIYSPGTSSWETSEPDYCYINTCINNTEDKIYLDEIVTPTYGGGSCSVYQLGENVLVLFNETSARYWRFVFGNNARNGERIKVGMIRLGMFTVFDSNPDMNFVVGRNIISKDNAGVAGINNNRTLGGPTKHSFDISMAYSDTRVSNSTDYTRLFQAYVDSTRNGDGLFLVLSDKDDKFDTSTSASYPLVFRCYPEGDFAIENVRHGIKSTTLKLREI